MTTHAHDPARHGDGHPAEVATDRGAARTPARPRWLVPGLVVGIIAAALVVAGVLPVSTVIYAGLIGGMILMHVGGARRPWRPRRTGWRARRSRRRGHG